MVDKKKAKAEATVVENDKEKNTEGNEKKKKKKGNRHHKKVVIKSNHLSHAEVQALHQKMLEATNDGSTPPMQPAVSNAMSMQMPQMPMQMPNIYGGSQMAQFPQQTPTNNFQPATPETHQHTQSSQRDDNVDDNEYGFEGNENPETTVMHKLKKKAQKKHHHHHHNHHHKKEEGPINIYDLGKGILESFTLS